MGTVRIETELIVTDVGEQPARINLNVTAEHDDDAGRIRPMAELAEERLAAEQRDPIEGTLADWHSFTLRAAGTTARKLAAGMGIATEPQHGTLIAAIKGDASRLTEELAVAERAAREFAARQQARRDERTEDRVLRSDERPPDEYVTHDTARPVDEDELGTKFEHPRYIDDELESIAVEVGCAMFGEAYRMWLDSGDEYGVASRQRGAGALRSSVLWRRANGAGA